MAKRKEIMHCSVIYAFFVVLRCLQCDDKHCLHIAALCRSVYLSNCCAPPPLPPSVHLCFRLGVMSQGAARGLIYLQRYFASFPYLMGDTGAWPHTGMGDAGQERSKWPGGRLDSGRKRDAIKSEPE